MKISKRSFLGGAVASMLPSGWAAVHAAAGQAGSPKIDRAQVENIVRRSYQYVAMYNVINKGALQTGQLAAGGWNKLKLNTRLADADVKVIARPNNDTLYQIAILDLREEPVVLDEPAFNSKFVSLECSAYDHYCTVPTSTRQGDFKKPQKLLFYTQRTKSYRGQKVKGIDRYLEMTGDFVYANHRVMPHAREPERFKQIVSQIEAMKVMTLSEYLGGSPKSVSGEAFPDYGKTDADIFGNNLLEVMQFVFNHTTFSGSDNLDRALLATYKPLGVAPGQKWDPAKTANIDGALFREVAEEVAKANIAILLDPKKAALFVPKLFQPKGKTELNTLVLQSVAGPMGNPANEALYPPVGAADGKPLNAVHDYVIKMSKDELPPAKAFWSLTLYDTKNGFFIPNPAKKYSVGENAGYKLDASGGIEIHIAAEKPAGVPDENWLPINRRDENLDMIMRVYVPDLEKFKTWKAPKAVIKTSVT